MVEEEDARVLGVLLKGHTKGVGDVHWRGWLYEWARSEVKGAFAAACCDMVHTLQSMKRSTPLALTAALVRLAQEHTHDALARVLGDATVVVRH